MTSPFSRTIMALEFLTVESLCAITNTVLPFIIASIPFSISRSVLVSIELVASSRISTGGLAIAALAIAMSCLCPCDRLPPSAVSIVSYPCGSLVINESALAILAASLISSSVASSFPYLILSAIVPVNKCVS